MGLIKETCAICSTPIIKLLSLKLGDGSFICDACLQSASDTFKSCYLDSLTIFDLRKYLSQKTLDKTMLATQFEKTKIFQNNTKDILYVDENRGLWHIAGDCNPDVFRLDQVKDCYLTDSIPRVHKDIHFPSVTEDDIIYEVIVIELNHPFIEYVRVNLTNTKSHNYTEDHMIGESIVAYFNSII